MSLFVTLKNSDIGIPVNMLIDFIFRDLQLLWKQILGSVLIVVGFGIMLYGSRPSSVNQNQQPDSSSNTQYINPEEIREKGNIECPEQTF